MQHNTLWKRPEGNAVDRHHTPIEEKEKPTGIPTINELIRPLAMRGGFSGRKGDGDSGAEITWRGYVKTLNYLEIAEELSAINIKNICV